MTVQSPQPPPPKKGLSPLAWVGIGCAVVVVLGMIAAGVMVAAGGWFLKKQADKFEQNPTMAAAEWAVKMNPDLELVKSDPETSTLTIKDKKTGKVVTISAEDVKEGRITFKTDEGTTTVDASGGQDGGTLRVTDEKGQETVFQSGSGAPKDLPSWVPTYPGGAVQGAYDTRTAEGRSATFTVTTQDSVDQVIQFYQTQLEAAGLKVQKSSFEAEGRVSGGIVNGTTDDQKRQANVSVSTSDQGTQALVTFTDKG